MMVETEGAITTKARQQKVHHLKRFGPSAGGASTSVFVRETHVSGSAEDEVAIAKYEGEGSKSIT